MRFPLRLKFFLFAAALAVVPLAMVGLNLTRLTRDELKSAANEDLTNVATQLRGTFDTTFEGRWLSPLTVIRWATVNGADAMGLAGQAGEIAPGMLADMLVVDGDPSADIRVLCDRDNLLAIFRDGVAYKDDLDTIERLAIAAE